MKMPTVSSHFAPKKSTGPEDNSLIRKPFRVGNWLVDPATGEISRDNEQVLHQQDPQGLSR